MIAVTTHTVFIKWMDVSNPVCQSRMNNWSQILVPMSKPDRIPALGRLTLEDVGLGVIEFSKSVHSRLSERPCVSQRKRNWRRYQFWSLHTHTCIWPCTSVCMYVNLHMYTNKSKKLKKVWSCIWSSSCTYSLDWVANCFHFRTWEVWLTGSVLHRSFPATDLGLLVRVALSQMG